MFKISSLLKGVLAIDSGVDSVSDTITRDVSVQTKSKSPKNKTGKFDFKLYAILSSLLLATVGGINWLIDPMWYSHGNRLTGQNFPFNERISKLNLFLRTKHLNYDCVILGSSRVIALKASLFKENNCFNFAVKGAEAPDIIAYAKFLKEEGLNPKRVYIGVDDFNFVEKKVVEKNNLDIKSLATPSFIHAYLSADIFTFSIMTLLGMSPDEANYYNSNFEIQEFPNVSTFKPTFFSQEAQKCSLDRIELYQQIPQIFPNAEIIGYVPPRSPWDVVNGSYNRGLTDCHLQAFYQVGQNFDRMYDFSIPSGMNKDPKNSYDGSHFNPKTNDKVAEVIQGNTSDFGVKVDDYSFEEYRDLYKEKLKEFLQEEKRIDLWKN